MTEWITVPVRGIAELKYCPFFWNPFFIEIFRMGNTAIPQFRGGLTAFVACVYAELPEN